MGISRAAVWKSINKLREQGCAIEAVTNRGYRLLSCPDLVSPEFLTLSSAKFGQKIYYLPSTPSTNLFAKAEAVKGAPDGSLFLTDEQTAGRGRMGRTWSAGKDSLTFSVLLRPSLAPSEITTLTLVAGLAVAEAIRQLTDLSAGIKWPNDVVLNGKKVCGILTEMAAEAERIAFAVVGIGINVNNAAFPEALPDKDNGVALHCKATSLALESGKAISRSVLLDMVLQQFEKYYAVFLKEGITPVLEQYSALCVTLGKEVCAQMRDGTVTGTARAVASDGSLVIDTAKGELRLQWGEVSVRGLLGYC